ncbi:MAG: hypothetical protein V4616_14440 [Bacteroidota bacterium]
MSPVLLIGIDPQLIDFSSPEFAAFPGISAETIQAGYDQAVLTLKQHDIEGVICWVDFGDTAAAVVRAKLKERTFDGALIGAGIRVPATNLLLFEQLVNEIHISAPQAKLMFNSSPVDTVETVLRSKN